MADNVKWFKLSNTMFEDDKVEYIESFPDGDTIVVIWIKLLCLASKGNNSGKLLLTQNLPYTEEMIANKFKKPIGEIQSALALLKQLEMIEVIDNTICITNWNEHQNVEALDKIREQTRARVAKHRAKTVNDNSICNATVTECNDNCNATVTLQCNDFALNSYSNSNIYNNNINNKTNNRNIDSNIDRSSDILEYSKVVEIAANECRAVYLRHSRQVDNKCNTEKVREVIDIIEDLQGQYSYEEIKKVFAHANKTYIVLPKYDSLDIAWVLNNINKVMQLKLEDSSERQADSGIEEKDELTVLIEKAKKVGLTEEEVRTAIKNGKLIPHIEKYIKEQAMVMGVRL